MVQTFGMPSFYRQAPLTVDTTHAQQKYYNNEDEDSSILDDTILDHNSSIDSGLEMSPPMVDSRRESFAVGGPSLFSPKQEEWQAVEMQSVSSNNPFVDQHASNHFMSQQPQSFAPHTGQAPQGGQWSMSTSGAATPLPQFDGLPADFDFHRQSLQAQTPFTNSANHVPLFSTVGSQSMPSPQKEQWMAQNPVAAAAAAAAAAASKKMRPGSPSIRSHNELRRGDGIRKKNARFDIPAERNLSNIDQLIAQSTDDQEIKELKQQKRLLRNRQAALDSRQRKKMHTERLEDEKKQFTTLIADMEDDIERLKLQVESLMNEKQNYTEYIEKLNFEKEEMIRVHTIETGELRKKVGVLSNHVQSLEAAAMPTSTAMPGHGAFPGHYGEMDGMGMDGNWENMGLFNEFAMDQQAPPPPPPADVKQEMQMVPAKKQQQGDAEVDKPSSQGGLLFMLFLVGAFVISSRQTPSIPRVSEDVRAASATLLDNVLKDAGVTAPTTAAGLAAMAPQPSGSWPPQPMTGLDGVAPSMLGELSDALTQPTEQQANEHLFSLTPAQYNGVGAQDFLQNAPPPPERSTSQGRRNLADALASMRGNSKAEVYTRSLLWDQIPSDVVRTFAKMVAECSGQNTAEGSNAEA